MTSGKSLGSHGPAAKTKRSALMRSPFARSTRFQLGSHCRGRSNLTLYIGATTLDEDVGEHLHGSTCHQGAEPRLVETDVNAVEVNHRELPRHLGTIERLGRRSDLLMRRKAVADVLLLSREEKEDSAFVKDWKARHGIERLPFAQAVERHAGVDRVLAVGAARQPGFAT